MVQNPKITQEKASSNPFFDSHMLIFQDFFLKTCEKLYLGKVYNFVFHNFDEKWNFRGRVCDFSKI